MKQYVDLLKKIVLEGEKREDRTGVGTLSIFGGQLEFDLTKSFPLVTIKETRWKLAFLEMLWFLRGEANTDYLKLNNFNLWDAWADERGNLGPVYGVQWRKWPPAVRYSEQGGWVAHGEAIDQIKNLIELIKTQPRGRRHIVTAWNPSFLSEMGLPPCHRDFQCYVSNDHHLDLMMAIRSWDTCLGGPFNIAQYALLTYLIGRATGLTPRRLIINYGDAHIYLNHVEAIWTRLTQCEPIPCAPLLVFKTDNVDIDGYKPDDFDFFGYAHHPFLKLPIAV
jgi:thymidylate synthase